MDKELASRCLVTRCLCVWLVCSVLRRVSRWRSVGLVSVVRGIACASGNRAGFPRSFVGRV